MKDNNPANAQGEQVHTDYINTLRTIMGKWNEVQESRWFSFVNVLVNLCLACLFVLPMMNRICSTIRFTFEANDDSAVQQILDGSFTGRPDAHAIFIKYPLSWFITRMYRINPVIHFRSQRYENVNWYLASVIILYAFALTVVLFRLLSYLKHCRLLICIFFDLGFLFIWLPCFARMTFSTSAAFFGCMALLFLAFCTEEEAWRPWNLLVLGILLTAAYCMRTQCLYMILPFLVLEIIWKYHIRFFTSVKPWFVTAFCGLLLAGVFFLNVKMYGSQAWKRYLIYNHARAYMQDYVGFPDYEENERLYDDLKISEAEQATLSKYTYCMVDDFSTDWIESLYQELTEKEAKDIRTRIKEAEPEAKRYLREEEQAGEGLKKASFYFWVLAVPLYILTVIFCFEGGMKTCLIRGFWDLFFLAAGGFLLWAEWIYLAMNGRFPQRVEEAIRLLTLTVGLMAAGHLLCRWREKKLLFCPVIIQLIICLCLMNSAAVGRQIKTVRETQNYYHEYAGEKAEIAAYCGDHPGNWYILDTGSVTKGARPFDDLHQGNWFMSGSWTAFSPLYYEKLKGADTDGLGRDFVTRDHVYVITKGRKNLAAMMGLPEDRETVDEIVDEIATSQNSFFEVYRVKGIREKD